MRFKKHTQTPADLADNENMAAKVEKQAKTIEKQDALIQYLAEMTDVYIPPEEEENDDVQNIAEIEENV